MASRVRSPARGLARGDRVAILSANRTEYLAAYYGIMRAGLAAVPVNFKFPRETIHFILSDAGAKLVFCDRPRRADCPPGLPVVCFGGEDAERFDRLPRSRPIRAVVPRRREPAMFLYTSGSTGTPEGRRALAPEPPLGGGDAARARTSTATAT